MPASWYRAAAEVQILPGAAVFDGIKIETVKSDCRATAAGVAIGGANWVPIQVPTPARVLGGAVVGRRAGGHGDG